MEHALADVVEQRQVQVLLGVEVLVEHGLGDAGGVGDVVHRRAVEAVLREHLHRHVEDLLAALAGGESDAHDAGQGNEAARHSPRSRSSRSAALTA